MNRPSDGVPGAPARRRRRSPLTIVLTALGLLIGVLAVPLATGTPAAAVPPAVATTRTVSGFPRWYADEAATRVEPCLEAADPFCVVLANPGIFDPAQPLAFPTNFPDEFFYTIVDSDRLTTPGCAGTPPGRALMRVALEGTFVNGVPEPGAQMVFGRVRFTVTSGLCPNTPYTFTYPYGQVSITTDAVGGFNRGAGTVDIGCAPAGAVSCDFSLALPSTVMRSFLRWDPAVAPAAPAGYLGDPNVLHTVVGAPFSVAGAPANFFQVTGGTTPALRTNLFSVSGRIAGPLQSAPESLDAGNQPVGVASAPRTITLTNVSPAAVAVSGVSVSPAGGPFAVTGSTCGNVAVDATCTVTLTFTPTVVGPVSASLVVAHGSFRSPTVVPLVGTGTTATAPAVSSAPTVVDFHRVLIGTRAAARGVVVRNAGPGTFVPGAVSVNDSVAGTVGDRNAFLPLAGNDCPAAGLLPGASCTVSVAFSPTAQRAYAATLSVAGTVNGTAVTLTSALTGRGGIATSSTGLDGVGPDGLGSGSFPTWYQDDRGVRLAQCINPADARCIVLADATFNPALPVAFPTNYPGEAFYFLADSDQLTTPGCGAVSPPGRAAFRAATEQTFGSGAPLAGDQMVFNRVRLFVTSGLCPGQTYSFVHPYGTFTFVADDEGGLKRPAGTEDVGCVPSPTVGCNFNFAVESVVGDGYLRWDSALPAPPAGYLGDAATLHTVAGSPYIAPGATTVTNSVQLRDANGAVLAATNLFTVMGRIDPSQTGTRYQTVAPRSVAFPAQDVGTTSAARVVTLESVGTTATTVSGVTVTGANAADFTATTSCASQAVGSRCTVSVTFRPGAAGARTATLVIASNATNGAATGSIPLSGTGVGASAPVVSVAPATVTFADQTTGTTSAAQNVTVSNTGTAPLTVSAVTVGGTNAADFALTNGCTAAVAAGGSCTLAVRFTPGAAGARTGSLAITSNGGTATVALAGNGVAPAVGVLTVAPASLTFAGQTTGGISAAQTVTVSNVGTAPLTLSTVAIGGLNGADFTLANPCPATLAAGASCTPSVRFAPSAVGTRTATLSISSSVGNASVALTGTGVAPATPVLAVTPASLTFAAQGTGTTSVAQNVTVANTGTGPLTVSAVAVGGVNAADFAITNGCTVAVAAGGSCTLAVRFTPGAAGARTGSLSVTSDGGAATVALAGSGVAPTPALAVTPTAQAFGNQVTRVASTARTVTLTNSGSAALTITGGTLGGLNAADFTAASACPASLAVGASCTISFTFRPTVLGARTATYTPATNAANGAVPVTLTGTGVTAVVNGSFETPALAAGASVLNPTGASWTFTGASLVRSGNSLLTAAAIPDGAQVAHLPGNSSRISQSITTGPGAVLAFRATQGRQGLLPATQVLAVWVDGVFRANVTPASGSYSTHTVALNVTTAGAHTVEIRGTTFPFLTSPNALVDSVSVA